MKSKKQTHRRKNKTQTKRHKRGGKKYDNKITPDEIGRCNNMCATTYLENKKMVSKNAYKTNPFLQKLNKTDREIEKQIDNNRTQHITDCQNIYCNPKCKTYFGLNEKLRYVCPACQKRVLNAKKKGAITFCQYNDIL